MEITYTYEVTKINADKKTFTVIYRSQNRNTIEREIPHPYVGDENIDLLIQQYSPVIEWANAERTLDPSVTVGLKNTITAHFSF